MSTVLMHSDLVNAIVQMPPGSTSRLSLDLGRTSETVERFAESIRCRGRTIPISAFSQVASAGNTIYLFDHSTCSMLPLQIEQNGRFYQLRNTGMAPTVMISGIQMHSLADAWSDSRVKAELVVRQGDWVFDTCGGLLYTAHAALESGAGLVVTTEPDAAVRWLRDRNPWSLLSPEAAVLSRELTAQELIAHLPDGSMDTILHDPPRFSLAGQLYGAQFYESLRRILRPGGKLYHYTGIPYSKGRGRRFTEGVSRRLKAAGFEVTWNEAAKGLFGRLKN